MDKWVKRPIPPNVWPKLGKAVSVVLVFPMGPRMALSILFSTNPRFRSSKVLIFFAKGILTMSLRAFWEISLKFSSP
jgi:hypothetical protein